MLNEHHINAFLVGNKLKLLSMKSFRSGHLWEVIKTNSENACLRCGSVRTVKAGRCTSLVRDEPVRQREVWLKIHKHRIYCKDCKKTFTESVPGIWPKRRSTQRFRKAVAQSCSRMSDLSTVSRVFRISHGFAYGVYYEQVEVKLREFKSRRFWPEVVGLDEHFFRRVRGRGTEFVTMITDLKNRRTFELAQGKDHESLTAQLSEIPGRESVKVVVIDMSSSYRSFAKKFFPNAVIVADKFHVLRLFTPQIMKAGKEIHGHRKELSTRRKLLCSRKNLDYFVRFEIDQYLRNHDKLDELYRWKEKLFEFYRTKGLVRARQVLMKMLEQMSNSKLDEVQRLRRTFLRWRNEILLYFENGYTNGFTERMNGTGKLVQRRAFGYKNFRNYRLRVLSACLAKAF
jgi:transposase